ncbi:MAG: LCP family protein [Agathobacter sp.]
MKEKDLKVKPKKKGRKKRRQIGKIVAFGLEIMLLVVVLIGAKYVFDFVESFSKIQQDSEFSDDSDAGINIGDTGIDTEYMEQVLEGYTNIALFGLDNRSIGDYNKGRSDSIMIASINNKTKEVKIVSVYRDTYLSIGDGKFNKANAAYSKGGVKGAVQMLNSNLDLDIKEYVCVDWAALIQAIDALGGVEIDVTEAEVKYINRYVSEMEKEIGSNGAQVKKAGLQTLNGAQATAYSRIRYTAGNDFKRASRQRIVLEAMLNKAKSASIDTLLEICRVVFDDISTTLSLNEIFDLVKDVTKYTIQTSAGFPYDLVTRNLSGSGDTVVPVDLEANVSKLHYTLFGTEDYKPSYAVHAVSQAIMQKTGVDENTKPYNLGEYDNISGADGTNWD